MAALAALLAVLAPYARIDEAFTIDEGAYGIQVRSLEAGGWGFQYAGAPIDPGGRWLPLYNPARGAGDSFAYVKQPAYPVLQWGASRVVGDVLGLHLWGLLGALGAAVAAWLVAREVQPEAPGAERVAFWVAAAAPVFVNAYIVWAHSLSAALAGFALLAALRLCAGAGFGGDSRRNAARSTAQDEAGAAGAGSGGSGAAAGAGESRPGRPGAWVVLLAACIGLGVLVRAEGLLFAGALAGGLLAGLRGRSWAVRAGLPALCVAAAGAAFLADRAFRSAIAGRSYGAQGLRGDDASPFAGSGGLDSLQRWAEGRLEGVWKSLFRAGLGERRAAVIVAAALVLVAFAGWVARRRRPNWQRDVTVTLSAAAVLYVLQLRSVATQPITGLFAAWPLALLGLAMVPRDHIRKAAVPAVTAALLALAVIATQYRFGGGREWGGRFFFPMVVPVAVLAALGLRRLGARRVLAPLAVALAVLPTVAGLRVLHTSRTQVSDIIREVTAGRPAVIMTHVSGLPPFAWKEYPQVGWLAVPPGEFAEAGRRLRAAGVPEVLLLAPNTTEPSAVPAYAADDVTGPEARTRGWRTFLLRAR